MPAAKERTFTRNGLTTVTTDAATASWLLSEGWAEQGTGTTYVPPTTPQQVEARVDQAETDIGVLEVEAHRARILHQAQTVIAHAGGTRECYYENSVGDTVRLSWAGRFLVIGIGRPDKALIPDGHFSIRSPAVGTTIKGHAGSADRVTKASWIGPSGAQEPGLSVIPLQTWEALYYELPYGESSVAKDGNWHVARYVSDPAAADFMVPDNWVMIALRMGDHSSNYGGPDTVYWCDGISMTAWKGLSYQNGWIGYGGDYQDGWFRKMNERVEVVGLIKNGPIGSIIANLPQGFRPQMHRLFSTISNAGTGRLDIYPDGNMVAAQGGSPWFALDGISFHALR